MESLSNKYRPKTFEEVLGQDITVKILKRQMELDKPSSAYLFDGVTGGGKTTLARLINSYLNGFGSLPIEIDAASNSGVDNVRNIIESAQERSLTGKYKIFIIDECHSLSNAAWQAFLKCIEETPKYTIFIFCTTEIQKVPETIKNRCQHFHLNRIPTSSIYERLCGICGVEGIVNYTDTAKYISKIAEGSMRNALSMLDKCLSYSTDFNIDQTLKILGKYSYKDFFRLTNYLIDGDQGNILEVIDQFYKDGKDLKLFVDQYLDFCLDLNKYLLLSNFDLIKIPKEMQEDINKVVNLEGASTYYNLIEDKLLQLKMAIKNEISVKQIIEVYMLQISRGQF